MLCVRFTDGEFKGGDILDDAFGYMNSGVAQGGIVQAHNGKWYGMFFQDRGAVGRCPFLIPMHIENGLFIPDDRKVPEEIEITSTRPWHIYRPLSESDTFLYRADNKGKIHLKKPGSGTMSQITGYGLSLLNQDI